jgi:hypothetical protein
MVAPWHQRARDVDQQVDNVWGEQVKLIPWQPTDLGDGMPDLSRAAITTVAVVRRAQAVASSTGDGFTSMQVTDDVVISVREEPLEQCALQKGDRIFLLDRNETVEVAFFGPEPSGRPDVHCIRLRGLD